MIVLSKAKEVKAASATSTYPAVVVAVGNPSSALVKLWFYCPATMTGLPEDAKNPGGNNVVEAPRKPHQGNVEYNFQIGDIIIISYSDGNLNTPQFVRYVTISDDVRAINQQYVGGDAIISGGYFNIDDESVTLDSDILQKAISLLPAVRLCAKGADENNDFYFIRDGLTNPFVSDLIFAKCGIYGTEFITLDAPNLPVSEIFGPTTFIAISIPMDLEYNGGIYEPDITFLDFIRYLYNGGVYVSSYDEIIETFKKGFKWAKFDVKDAGIPKDEYMALYLYQAFAGLDDWETGAKRINASVYEESEKEELSKPKADIDGKGTDWEQYIEGFYYYYYDIAKNIWTAFSEDYRKELDRLYAIILHNNIWRLKQRVGYYAATNLLLLILATIATAWQVLEHMIVSGDTSVFNEWEDDSDVENKDNYSAQLSGIINYLYDRYMTVSDIKSKIDEIAEFFSEALMVILNKANSTADQVVSMKNHAKENIKTAMNYILGRSDYYLDLFGTTITGIPTTSGGGSSIGGNSELAQRVLEIAANGVGDKNGNKYISWYNATYDTSYSSGTAWCAIFIQYCMGNAGVKEESCPNFVGCITGVNLFKKLGRFYYRGNYEPKPGDLVFFEWDGQTNDVDHVGLVEYVDSNGTLHTIEGNTGSNECARQIYNSYKDSSVIVGYGVPLYNVDVPDSGGTSGSGGEIVTNTKCRVLATREAEITQHYGDGGHGGIDLVGYPGSLDTIIAHSDGVVTWSQSGYGNMEGSTGDASYGNAVKIKHNDGYYTLYAHMEYISVSTGQNVKQGQKLGYMGNTGNSFGAHLHFEVRNTNDDRVNPEPYVNSNLP